MRRYIKIWLVIILVVDLAAFGYMAITGGRFINRNREYIKAHYTGQESWEVVFYVEDFEDSIVDENVLKSVNGKHIKEINGVDVFEIKKYDGDLKYFFEILGIIDIVLVGVAVFLYIVFANIHARPGVSIGFAILFVAFLVGAAYVGHLYHDYISTPDKILDYYYVNYYDEISKLPFID